MKNLKLIYSVTLSVLVAMLGLGFWLAMIRPLWNDEFYTQVANIHFMDYWRMLIGRINEGNNCPLFYALQKAIEQAVGYRMPEIWVDGKWLVYDFPSQMILRINPVIFMALSISAIFYYFARFYGWLTAFYSLFVSLSSYMVWAYWAEARPYALWVFLTTIQSLLFLRLVEEKDRKSKLWRWLCGVNVLMSFTVVFGMVQAVIVSFWLWVGVERNWRRYLWVMLLPVTVTLFYYVQAPKYKFWFDIEPEWLVRASFSRDRFYLLLIYGLYVGAYFLQRRKLIPTVFTSESILKALPYLGVTASMLAAAFLLLYLFKRGESHNHEGFPISNRYFIYLTPVGIISTTLLSVHLLRSFNGRRWMQVVIVVGIGYLLVARIYKTYSLIKGYYGY